MKTILVIEDEAQTRDIFVRSLTFEGFHAIAAESGAVGLKLAETHLPDLIVCDIMMPDLDGYEVLSTLRQGQSTAAIPFIFLTAKVTMADLRQGMELGADDYLTKPCTVEQFLAAIATRLERQQVLKQWYTRELQEPGTPIPKPLKQGKLSPPPLLSFQTAQNWKRSSALSKPTIPNPSA